MRRLLVLALLTSTFGASAHAQPEPQCLDRGDTLGELRDMGGWVAAAGVSHEGHDLEWWAVPDGRWLLLVVSGDEEVCVLDVGDRLTTQPQPEDGS